jgi:hypothetical protein
MIDKPGRYQITFDEYLKDPCPEPSLTRSTIKALLTETPRKAFLRHPRLNPQAVEPNAEKFDIGTAAHSVFLNGEDCITVIDADDWRTKAAKEARDEAYKAKKTPLLAGQYADVLAMVSTAEKALYEWEGDTLEIADGTSEFTYAWKDKNGTWCRIRPDWIHRGPSGILCLDYKTTSGTADPQEYNRIAIANGLDIQDAFYRRGIKAVDGFEPDFIFMVQETYPPYDCAFMRLDMMTRDMGEEKVDIGIREWGKYLESGKWPGYGNNTYTMEAPPWSLAAWEIRKFSIGIANQGEI